ncbi:glycosyltransferase [Brucella sp. LJL56]
MVILIPAYGQPSVTAETLRTAVAQQCDFPFAVVVVNDGCPSPETHEICQTFTRSIAGQSSICARRITV